MQSTHQTFIRAARYHSRAFLAHIPDHLQCARASLLADCPCISGLASMEILRVELSIQPRLSKVVRLSINRFVAEGLTVRESECRRTKEIRGMLAELDGIQSSRTRLHLVCERNALLPLAMVDHPAPPPRAFRAHALPFGYNSD